MFYLRMHNINTDYKYEGNYEYHFMIDLWWGHRVTSLNNNIHISFHFPKQNII